MSAPEAPIRYDEGTLLFRSEMPTHIADALILRTYKLGESDRLVVFLTRDRGKKRGVAKNARQSRRRFGGALEPLTHGRVAYVERERRDLVRLEYVDAIRSPLAIAVGSSGAGRQGVASRRERAPAGDVDALGHVGYFAELLDEWAQENDPNETLFRLGVSVLEALVAGVPPASLARYFEYWLLRLQGVYQPPRAMSAEARAFLEVVRLSSPIALDVCAVRPKVLAELAADHRAQLAGHLEKDLRSARVLHQLG